MCHYHRVLLQSPGDDAQQLLEFMEEGFLGNRLIQLISAKLLHCRLYNIFHNLSQLPNKGLITAYMHGVRRLYDRE